MALPEYAAIRRVARLVEDGVDAALRAYREGRAPDEPRLVERMLVEIEHAVSGSDINGLRWEAGTLSSHRRRGKKAAETRYGADFLGILEVQLPDYHVVKGFFAQAKLIASGDELGARERERLREQCARMLSVTPDAFVFVLQPDEVTIVPAISVNAGDNEPLTLYRRGVERFFEEHFACFIGDGVFGSADVRALDQLPELRARFEVRHVIYIAASTDVGNTRDRLDSLRSPSGERPR